MTKLTGGEAVVQSLINHGVDTLFGLPGVQNDWLYNALYDHRDEIRVIHSRHEQGVAYMALGYALATGGIGVYNVVPGPGLLNSSAALATAFGLNAKVLCLVGQIPTSKIGKGQGVLHELPNQMSVLEQLTKWSKTVAKPEDAPLAVAEAFQQLISGRPRPVGLEVPMDVLAGSAETAASEPLPPFPPPTLDPEQISQAATALAQSKQPMIYVGGGALGVVDEINELAETLQAPVIGYRTGQGIMDNRSHLGLHMPPSHELWKTTDVVLLVGTNARIPLGKWGRDDQMTVIRIDIDETTHTLFTTPDIAITGSAETAVPQLLSKVLEQADPRPSRKDELEQLKADWVERTAYLEPQMTYLKVIREELGEDGIFVDELTQVGFASRIAMQTHKPRTFISTGYMGTLGWGFPTALGVKVAKPDTPVVAIAGDGGFMFGVQDLATAVQHRIGLVTIVFNNSQYGNVQQMQRNNYDGRVIATDLHNPDFVALAESFGANGVKAESADELRAALRNGFASDLPTIIEVPMGDVPSVDRFRSLGKVRG